MKLDDILEVAQKLCKNEDDNITFSEEENKILSKLLRDCITVTEVERYFNAFDKLTEEQINYFKDNTFKFISYVLCDVIYLAIDDELLTFSLSSRSFEFQQAYFDIIKKKIKEKD